SNRRVFNPAAPRLGSAVAGIVSAPRGPWRRLPCRAAIMDQPFSAASWQSEHETEVRRRLQMGAHKVQIDFTEGRLAVQLDPSGGPLHSFIDLTNRALSRFSAADRPRIGVHTCPGSDRDSTHSGDVDYAELLPSLFELKAGNFYIALAGETDRSRVLKIIREHITPGHRIFVGVVSPIDPRVETSEVIRDP